MKGLTARQESILRFILDYKAQYECSPTFDEIARVFGIQRGAAQAHTEALVRKGALVQIVLWNGRNKGWRTPSNP